MTSTNSNALSINTYCIYKHQNKINGKIYIGQTCHQDNPNKRWDYGWGYKKQKFWEDITKYGWNNFTHEIIERNLSEEQANERERYWIAYYQSNNELYGYNQSSGGQSDSIQSLQSNQQRKDSVNRYWASEKGQLQASIHSKNIKGVLNPMYGKHHSEQVKQKQSQLMKTEKNCNLGKTGINNHLSKPVFCIELQKFFGSGQEAMRLTGVDASSISKCCKNKVKKAGQYHWRYATEQEIVKIKEEQKNGTKE